MSSEWTRFSELNDVLSAFVGEVAAIVPDRLVGVYLQGSFALHEGDEHSDCDFLVVLEEGPTAEQLGSLVLLHDAIPQRAGHWTKHLEGSYPIAADLRDLAGLDREWWYVDHGSRAVIRSTHCNREVVRWTLREHGIVLTGPAPTAFMDPVPPEALRARSRTDLATVLPDILSWARLDTAWAQRYVVATACRIAYTLKTAEVTSKRLALDWAMTTFGDQWEPLLRQVQDERRLGLVPTQPPRPGSVEQSLEFVRFVQGAATSW